jgi:rhodanese-related sulfurtransferase
MMTQRTPFQCIGALEAEALTRRDGVLVLDVRDAKAYGRSHIKGAEHVRPVLIYCYHGHASKEYAKVFSDFGFSEVYSMDGGYEAWSRRPRFKGAVLDAPAVSSPIG